MKKILEKKVKKAIAARTETINLHSKQILGKGTKRHCYIHPADNSKCIKIMTNRNSNHLRNSNAVEWLSFHYLLKNNTPLTHIAKCYEYVDTNLGLGLIFERVQNEDGSFSKTLLDELQSGTPQETLEQAMLTFMNWVMDNSILLVDVHSFDSTNLMLRHTNSGMEIVGGLNF